MIETGSDPSDRGKMNDHVCFLIRHSRKILMPPVEIVHLVHKFYPECVKNMPPVVKVTGKRKIQTVGDSNVEKIFIIFSAGPAHIRNEGQYFELYFTKEKSSSQKEKYFGLTYSLISIR